MRRTNYYQYIVDFRLIEFPQPPTETAYKKTVGWAAVLFTRPKRKRTPNGGFETTDFKTAALSVISPYRRSAWHTPFSMPLPAGRSCRSSQKQGQGRKPVTLAPRPPFRLPSTPPSCAGWAVLAAGWMW